MSSTRAEYMRAYRAAKATGIAARTCDRCGDVFVPERGDARTCSDACRAELWRSITHRRRSHRPEGWTGQTCDHREGDVWCSAPATWATVHVRNATRATALVQWFCDEHVAAGVEVGDECDEWAACRNGRSTCPAAAALLEL